MRLYRCADCQRVLSTEQLRPVAAYDGTSFSTCPECCRVVDPLPVGSTGGSLGRRLWASLSYPFRPGVLVALLGVALWVRIFVWLAVNNAFPPMIPVALLLALAVPVAYAADILRAAAAGQAEAPEGADAARLGALFAPTLRLGLALGIASAPALAAWWLAEPPLVWALGAVGLLLAPALLITAAYGRPRLLVALRLIGRLPGQYLGLLGGLLVVAATGAALTVGCAGLLALTRLAKLPLIPGVLVTFCLLYGAFSAAHFLGGFLRRHRFHLGCHL